jgi:hypothetical protein
MTTVITIEKKKSSKIRMVLTAIILLALTCGACGLFGAITGTTKPTAAEPVVKAQAKPTAVPPTAALTRAPTVAPVPQGDLDEYGCNLQDQLDILGNLQLMLEVMGDVNVATEDMAGSTTNGQLAAKAEKYLPTIKDAQAKVAAMDVPGCFEDELWPAQAELAGALNDLEMALTLVEAWEFDAAIPYISGATTHMENVGIEVDALNPGSE